MTEFPLTDWDARRIAVLYQLEILDTPPEKEFDHIVALAAQLCEQPIATLGFFAHNRTWFKACKGIDFREIPAPENDNIASFFSDAAVISIPDTLADVRTATRDYVLNHPFIRSITTIPLSTEEGLIVGHLSVADTRSCVLTAMQLSGLEMLAKQTTSLLKLRLQVIKMRHIENQSKRTLDQISPVFKNAIDAVIVTSEAGIISQWNPRAEAMFGWTAEEAKGCLYHQLLIPERYHASFWQKRLNYRVDTGSPLNNLHYEFIAKKKDDTEFVVAMGVSPVIIDGEPLLIGFASDITERKQIAKALMKQKRFYENILNKTPTDIAVFDAEHRYLFVNPFAIKDDVFRQYIIGKDDFEYAKYRNRDNTIPMERRKQFLKAKMTGEMVSWEDQLVNTKGEIVTLLRKLYPVNDEQGKLSFVIGFGIDISDRKKLEEEQNLLVEQLSIQNTQLFDFCNIVTHNLRGPLSNMSMLVELVEDSTDPEEQKELISKLRPVINGLNASFNELVETIQIKQDLEIKSEQVDLVASLQRTLEGLKMEVQKARAVFSIDFTVAPEVCFPPKYVDSIFHNLVSNALKYRSPVRDLEVKIYTRREGLRIFLFVEDNGLGIDMVKHRKNVFKIGKVFHSHPNAKGLGLYMTKTQVEVMGGKVSVESVVDKGPALKWNL